MGLLYEVHNKLGTKYQEKHYQRALETLLKREKMKHEREYSINVQFEKEDLGEFKIDFLIEDKIVVELKKVWSITQNDVKQVLRYLDAGKWKLAIIANFQHKRLQFRRVLN